MAYSILCIPQLFGASVYWGDPGVWGSHYPGPDDDVLIPEYCILNVNIPVEINNLTVHGTLYGYDAIMITNGDVLIGNTGSITVPFGGGWHFRIHGDLEINHNFVANTCIFYGDEEDDQSATITVGASTAIWSQFQQNNYNFHIDLLSDVSLYHPSNGRSTFQNADIRLNGHVLSNVNLTSVLLWGNTTDYSSGIAESYWWDVDLYNNVSLSGWVEVQDSGCVVNGNLLNTEFFVGGTGLNVTIEINGDFINNGLFSNGFGGSTLIYLSGNLTNNGQYINVPTYFDGAGTESSPQVITIGPLSDIQSDWNSYSSYCELIGNLNMSGFNWTVGHLKTQYYLIENVIFYNGTIDTQGFQTTMQYCTLNNITVNGDLKILDYLALGESNIVINGNLTNSGTLTTVTDYGSAITINGDLTNEVDSIIAPWDWLSLVINLGGNLFNYAMYMATTTNLIGSIPQHIVASTIFPFDSDFVVGTAGVWLNSDVVQSGGRTITLNDNALYLGGFQLSTATLINGNVYSGSLSSCVINSCTLYGITVEETLWLGDANNDTSSTFVNNGTITMPDTTPNLLVCYGSIVNNGMIAPSLYGALTVRCYDDITNPGNWNANTYLCGNEPRTIDATYLGDLVTVDTDTQVILTGVCHLPAFIIPAGSSLTIDGDGELVMNDNEYFTGNVINHGIFNNARNTFSGNNEFYGLGITVDDIVGTIAQMRVINTANVAPGMDFAIRQWWNLQTTFATRTPAPHNLVLRYSDDLLNGNNEIGLAVYYSTDNGMTWQMIPASGVMHDLQSNQFTVLESELNGLFTLSSQFYNWNPASISISVNSNGSGVTLNWIPTEGAETYRVEKALSPEGPFLPLITITSFSYEDINPGPRAFYRVIPSTSVMGK